jgi:hypothetical protein
LRGHLPTLAVAVERAVAHHTVTDMPPLARRLDLSNKSGLRSAGA